MLARGFRRFERGGKFGDHAAKLVRFSNVGVGGVIVAGKRNFSRAAQGGDGFAIRLRPACGERQLLFFVLLHLRISEGVFALIIFAILLAIGDVRDGGDRLENLEKMINAVEETQKRGLNRAEHRLHLRCELPHHTTLPLFEKLVGREPVSLVSLMDHSPGQRQFANIEKYREYYQGKYSLNDAEMARYEEEQLALAAQWSQPNRLRIAAMCRDRNIALASHDDATHDHVRESHQLGSVIAEFPTTFEAAEASRQHGMNVLMGAPNIVRGGSHSGNVAASKLASLGLLDILSSDYYPASLLDAAFRVADDEENRFTLPQAIRLVTKNPAAALNLQDRGEIAERKRADLVLAHRKGEHIHIDHVWRQGKRVF